jgi:hypothetical protein
MPLSTSAGPDNDLHARIDSDLRELLQSHQPQPLDHDLEAQLQAIRELFERSHPLLR